MFNITRIKLTLWYVAIVAVVSFGFSAIIYTGVISEIETSFRQAESRLQQMSPGPIPRRVALQILKEDFEKAKNSVLYRLMVINGVIIGASGVAGYILAGKTLRPIEQMLIEQKRFVADASHELKTPLTALRTELEVALKRKKINTKEATGLLKSNLEEVINLQKLSEDLLRLTRYTQSFERSSFEEVDLEITMNESVKKVAPMAKLKRIKIVKDIKKIRVRGNKGMLAELMVILLDNAVKYSPKKSTITVKIHGGRGAVIQVSDQGIGIHPKELSSLFERFYRADSSRSKNETSGYGLGLAIAKQIVDKHSGDISVSSKPGLGSTFKVTLPS